MSAPVNTVAAGGIAVVDVTATMPKLGAPVSEALPGRGIAVTRVASYGVPVTFDTIGIAAPLAPTNWNPADKNTITLSNLNLTATGTGATSAVRSVGFISSGKYYWEYTIINYNTNGFAVGICLASYSLSSGSLSNIAFVGAPSGQIYINGVNSGTLGTFGNGNIFGVAVDTAAKLIWFRLAPSGNWNGSGAANPATGSGGLSTSALAGALYGAMIGGTNDACTANFGASAFSGGVPSSFSSGLLV